MLGGAILDYVVDPLLRHRIERVAHHETQESQEDDDVGSLGAGVPEQLAPGHAVGRVDEPIDVFVEDAREEGEKAHAEAPAEQNLVEGVNSVVEAAKRNCTNQEKCNC